jgi:hypothetical protein
MARTWIVVSTKMLRAELFSVKSDLERELEKVVLDCAVCGRTVQYVGGLAGHWAHAEPAPHATPKLALSLSAGSMKSRHVRAGYFTPRRPDTSAIDRECL